MGQMRLWRVRWSVNDERKKLVPREVRESDESNRASDEERLVVEASKSAEEKRDIASPKQLNHGTGTLGIVAQGDQGHKVADEQDARELGESRVPPRALGHGREEEWIARPRLLTTDTCRSGCTCEVSAFGMCRTFLPYILSLIRWSGERNFEKPFY